MKQTAAVHTAMLETEKKKFSANAASMRTTTNGKNLVSLPISYTDVP